MEAKQRLIVHIRRSRSPSRDPATTSWTNIQDVSHKPWFLNKEKNASFGGGVVERRGKTTVPRMKVRGGGSASSLKTSCSRNRPIQPCKLDGRADERMEGGVG